jgi:hypothetical protein
MILISLVSKTLAASCSDVKFSDPLNRYAECRKCVLTIDKVETVGKIFSFGFAALSEDEKCVWATPQTEKVVNYIDATKHECVTENTVKAQKDKKYYTNPQNTPDSCYTTYGAKTLNCATSLFETNTELIDVLNEMSIFSLAGTKTSFVLYIMNNDKTDTRTFYRRTTLEVCKKFSELNGLATKISAIQIMCKEAKDIKPPPTFGLLNIIKSVGLSVLENIPFASGPIKLVKTAVELHKEFEDIQKTKDQSLDTKKITRIFERVISAIDEGMKLSESCALLNAGGKIGDVRRKMAYLSPDNQSALTKKQKIESQVFIKVTLCGSIAMYQDIKTDSDEYKKTCDPVNIAKDIVDVPLEVLNLIDAIQLKTSVKSYIGDKLAKMSQTSIKCLDDDMIKELWSKMSKNDFTNMISYDTKIKDCVNKPATKL